jgi:hypothetical protein
MNEIHRPQECINANCVNMCSIAQYEGFKHWFGNNPEKCPSYKKGEPINVVDELEKIKTEIENMWIKSAKDLRTGEVIYENLCEHSEVLEILEKHISKIKGD